MSISPSIRTSSSCFRTLPPEAVRYFRKTNIYPIDHGMVVRRELAEKHPRIVLNLLKAFQHRQRYRRPAAHPACDLSRRRGADPTGGAKRCGSRSIQHGIAANRHVLETAATYSVEQGLTPRLMKLKRFSPPAQWVNSTIAGHRPSLCGRRLITTGVHLSKQMLRTDQQTFGRRPPQANWSAP